VEGPHPVVGVDAERDAETQDPGRAPILVANGGREQAHPLDDVPRERKPPVAPRRQPDMTRAPLEPRQADRLPAILEPTAERRGSDEETARSAREAEFLGDRDERAQLLYGEACIGGEGVQRPLLW